tara:strand:+ start:435 stop:695 length:261 start_codon:yes stop_codon:yes gene_type:complete
MIKVITNKEINLWQLDQELGGQGLCSDFNNPENKIITTADNSSVTQKQLEDAVEVHIAQPEKEPTIEQKLASVGLNLVDLKTALGL